MDEHQPFEDDVESLGEPATPDALREIVARHQKSRTRTLGILLAVALVAGPLTGWAIGHAGGGTQQVSTASQADESSGAAANRPTPAGGGVASAQAFAFGGPDAPKGQHLFSRTSSDGIAIRAYRLDPPAPQPSPSTSTTTPTANTEPAPCPQFKTGGAPGSPSVSSSGSSATESRAVAVAEANSGSSSSGSAVSGETPPAPPVPPSGDGAPPPCAPMPPPCKGSPSVVADASNDAAVGQGFAPIDEKQPTVPLSHLSVNMFGYIENAPAMVVTVQTGPGVANVRLRLPSGATDEMAPVSGVAVLAHGSSARPPEGTVEALDASGKVLASTDVAQTGDTPVMACAFAGAGQVGVLKAPAPILPKPESAPPTTR